MARCASYSAPHGRRRARGCGRDGDIAAVVDRGHPGPVHRAADRPAGRLAVVRVGAVTADRSPAGIGGHLDAADVHPDPAIGFGRRPRDLLAVGLVDRGSGYLAQDGRDCFVSGGDFAVYDTSRPFTWAMSGDWRLRVYTWPRESIAVSEAELQQLAASAVCTREGVGFFMSPMLDRLTQSGAGMSGEGAVRLACEVAELAVTAAGEVSGRWRRRSAAVSGCGRSRPSSRRTSRSRL